MEVTCPRCGASLNDADAQFCNNCGLQQLRISEEAVLDTASSGNEPSATSTPHVAVSNTKADWRFALRCAGVVAGLGGLLQVLGTRFEFAAAAFFLWVLVAAMLTIVFYRRGRPTLPMNAGMGARLGITTGFFLSLLMLLISAVSAFVLRFHFHSHLLDDAMLNFINQMKAQPNMTPDLRASLDNPEYRAGLLLLGMSITGILLSGFMTVSGAVSGALLSTPRKNR